MLVLFCWFPLPLGVWERLQFVIVAITGLFSYPFFILRGDFFCVLPCVVLFLCFSVLLALRLPRLGKRANLIAFPTFVRFVLVWFCQFPLPLGVWEGLQFVIVAFPGLLLTSFLYFFPGSITIRIDTLWAQLLLEFSIDHFETMHTCSTWSVDVHVVLGLSSRYFYQFFFYFFYFVFSRFVSIIMDTLWAQLLLGFPTDHFETMHTCST